VAVETRFVAHLAAEQFIDRHVEGLALDVPQCDIDRGDSAGYGAAGEVVRPQHHVPVVFDGERVLPDQVFAVLRDRRGGRLKLPPCP
jgi:hypothetical protein